MIEYKGLDIIYDNYKDDEWPTGCYIGRKFVRHSCAELSYSGDSVIKTKMFGTADEVKKAIDIMILETDTEST